MINPNICKRVRVIITRREVSEFSGEMIEADAMLVGRNAVLPIYTKKPITGKAIYAYLKFSISSDSYYLSTFDNVV